jgi:hypothetical protein
MTAQYFVNMENAQLYFDAQLQRCKAPGSAPDAKAQTMYFVRVEEGGALLKTTWDIGLAEFTRLQRERGRLYQKAEA